MTSEEEGAREKGSEGRRNRGRRNVGVRKKVEANGRGKREEKCEDIRGEEEWAVRGLDRQGKQAGFKEYLRWRIEGEGNEENRENKIESGLVNETGYI